MDNNHLIEQITQKTEVKEGETPKTNLLRFDMQRPVTTNDGKVTSEKLTIEAPLMSLVPVPSFTMDELTVDFSMEVKTSEATENKSSSEVKSQVSYKSCFGLSANISGSVSSDSMHKRQSDSSATYNIQARAVQQPPSEGMDKLTSLFSQKIEPIPTKNLPT